jgi:hypothetical protein
VLSGEYGLAKRSRIPMMAQARVIHLFLYWPPLSKL